MNNYKDFFSKLKTKNDYSNYIVIDGVVGAGKSSLVEILKDELHYTPYYEPVKDNPFLDKFYKDKSKYSFPLQIFFLNKRFQMIKEINNSNSILDRSIYSDIIFAKMLKDSGDISLEEYELYKELSSNMFEYIKPPKLTVYLKNSTEKAINKINNRGRDYEQLVDISYWESLNNEYQDYFSDYNLSPLLIIDVDNLDFVKNEEDRNFIVEKIKTTIEKINLNSYISSLFKREKTKSKDDKND